MTYDEHKSDIESWATCSKDDQAHIAKEMANKYTVRTLRYCQSLAEEALSRRFKLIDPHNPTPDIEFNTYQVRLNILAAAIDHRAFVMNKRN